MKKIIFIIVSFILILVAIISSTDYRYLFYVRTNEQMTDWIRLNETPGIEDEYPPQGLTKVNSNIIISNHHFDIESCVYELNDESNTIERSFVMPKEAVHTGGLSWDGVFLYAVDYKSNKLYKIDYEESFDSGEAVVIDSFDTTLEGSSACGIILDNEIPLIAISDFRNSQRTIIVDLVSSFVDGSAEDNILYSYQNESFSQGLCYWNGYIFEVENKATKSIVNIYDFEKIKSIDNSEDIFVKQFYLPNKGGQDIYIDDRNIIISDAVTFEIYEGETNEFSVKE